MPRRPRRLRAASRTSASRSLQERTAICLAGNHDLVVLGKISLATFGGEAGAAAAWTREVLDAPARAFLTTLAPSAVTTGAELFHGSPRDPVWDYVLTEDAARWTFAATTAPLVLVGHSHIALELAGDGTEVRGGQAAAGTTLDLAAARRLLNPGSVGQPRDGDPRAAWLEVDFLGPGNLPPYGLSGRADAGRDARAGPPRGPGSAARARHLARPRGNGARWLN